MTKIKLFCFPYAGGSSVIFSPWKKLLDDSIELRNIELAGRGKRIHEPLYRDIPELINDVFSQIKDEIKDAKYALFGHSMGGMICYEVVQKIRENDLPEPEHIFFSGRNAPNVKKKDEKIFHLLSEEEFKKEVIELGGTSPEFFEHPELLELFLPVLRNDFKLAETATNSLEIDPLNCNISVFLGKNDSLISEQSEEWKNHTKKLCSIHYFEGEHLFINDQTQQIVSFINHTLISNLYVS